MKKLLALLVLLLPSAAIASPQITGNQISTSTYINVATGTITGPFRAGSLTLVGSTGTITTGSSITAAGYFGVWSGSAVSTHAVQSVSTSALIGGVLPSNIVASSVSVQSVSTAALIGGILPSNIVASSVAVQSVLPSAISAGLLGSGVIASSIAVQVVGTSNIAFNAITAAQIANNTINNGQMVSATYSNITVPAANVAAGSLGNTVIASSVAVQSVSTSAIIGGVLPSNVIASSVAVGVVGSAQLATSVPVVAFSSQPFSQLTFSVTNSYYACGSTFTATNCRYMYVFNTGTFNDGGDVGSYPFYYINLFDSKCSINSQGVNSHLGCYSYFREDNLVSSTDTGFSFSDSYDFGSYGNHSVCFSVQSGVGAPGNANIQNGGMRILCF